MTTQEKAKELINKYDCGGLSTFGGHSVKEISIQCALIAVDEIIRHTYMGKSKSKNDYNPFEYWQEVKETLRQKI